VPEPLRMLAVLAHPDDESLGVGGVLAKYAAEGVAVHLVTATRGERGRFFADRARPSDKEVGRVRESELHAAAAALGIEDVHLLGCADSELDRADPAEVIGRLAWHIRRVRPQVVVTFDAFGAYGHPDHIAISQFTSAAATAASGGSGVRKLYHMAWDQAQWEAYQHAFKTLVSRVDGVDRRAVPWPEWSITTRIDTRAYQETVWRAVQCHRTQIDIYGRLDALPPEHHEALWGWQTFYRVFSTVNGGRALETDLFTGLH
jgi:LmbE family N-acetylglucosaminyl deacetylase